ATIDKVELHKRLVFEEGVPVGGQVDLTVHPDGVYNFSGYFRATGFPSYNVSIVCAVKGASGNVALFTHSGPVHGTVEPGDRQNASAQQGKNEAIARSWGELAAGNQTTCRASTSLDAVSLWNAVKEGIGAVGTIVTTVGAL